jgi:hypothetical protein
MNILKKSITFLHPFRLIPAILLIMPVEKASVPAFLLPGWSKTEQSADTLRKYETFGMRSRKIPPKRKLIYEPVVTGISPGNEATVSRVSDRTIKIFYINRPGKADRLMSISSDDEGFSWREPEVEFTLPGEAYYANNLVRDNRGEMHCVFHIFGQGDNGYNGRHLDLWYCHTTGGGRSWNKPQKIFDGYVGAIRGFIQLRSNRFLLSFAKAVPSRSGKPVQGETDYGIHDIISMYSDDYGDTWHSSANSISIAVESTQVTRYGGVEPCLLELNNGRIWMLIRTNKGHLWQSFSSDQGATWSSASSTNFISSDSPATLLRLRDNRIIILWSGNQRWDDPRSYANGGREVLHAAISSDDGVRWKGFREVLNSPAGHFIIKRDVGTAYPSATETADGKIIFVSGQSEERALVMFDPDWLEESSSYDDFSGGLVQWTTFGAENVFRLVRSGPGKKKNELLIKDRSISEKANADAVWNFPVSQKAGIILEAEGNKGSRGIDLALTDHFSVSYDTLATRNSNIVVKIDNGIPGQITGSFKISVRWDCRERKASVYLNKKFLKALDFTRESPSGLNYLRLGMPGPVKDTAGYLIKSVRLIPGY